jgi:hypothetical protein
MPSPRSKPAVPAPVEHLDVGGSADVTCFELSRANK